MPYSDKNQKKLYNREYFTSYYQLNKEKLTIKNKAWAKAHPEKIKEYSRKSQIRRYGIEPEEFDRMLEEQQGRCKICQCLPRGSCNSGGAILHIDHDHQTGLVRGLICKGCNSCLGWYESKRAVIDQYLRQKDDDNGE